MMVIIHTAHTGQTRVDTVDSRVGIVVKCTSPSTLKKIRNQLI